MHFLIGLGILAGLVWFAFGAGAARILVGAALLGVVAVFGLLIVVAGIDIHRQSVEQTAATRDAEITARNEKIDAGLSIRACMAKHGWDRDAQTDCERAARDRVKSVAPAEIHRMAEKYLQEAGRTAADVALDRSERYGRAPEEDGAHVAVIGACMAKQNWDRDAQTKCDK
jgi:hypothetical protein